MRTWGRDRFLNGCGPAAALAMGLAACAFGQVLEFNLDGSAGGRAGGKALNARLGQGVKFVKSVEGQGVEPTVQAPAVIIPVPDDVWKPAGTLAFMMRLSRTIRFDQARPSMPLVNCPMFELTVTEDRKHVVLGATMFRAGEAPGTREERRRIAAATTGRLFWSHLKGGKWYHFAFTWDAAKGRMDTYLNGSIQQEMRLRRHWLSWTPPANPNGPLEIGGVLGEGERACRFAIDSVRLYPKFMNETEMAATLKGRPGFALAGEGRWDIEGPLDLKPYKLTLVYETDFSKTLNYIHEDELFEGKKRVRLPEGKDWVLEGRGKAWTEKGTCIVKSTDEERPGHLVLWNTRLFPESFLLEFGMSPKDSRAGLAIIFFATRNLQGGSPFDLGLPKRAGSFRTYHSGALNGYHASYWATNAFDGGILRRTTNLRKNAGFFMPCAGIDRIGGAGPGPHKVRLLKVGNRIRIETRGRMALVFDDDGNTYGPVWKDGWIGLRQMGHSRQVTYTHFKVWKVQARE